MHRAIKAGDLAILIGALALMIVLAAVSYLVAPPAGSDLRGSSYSARGDGAKAAFLLLKQLGYRVDRSFEPVAALRTQPSQTVLVIASPSQPASIQDRRALRAFLDRGGVVITTGGGGNFLPEMESVIADKRSLIEAARPRRQTPVPTTPIPQTPSAGKPGASTPPSPGTPAPAPPESPEEGVDRFFDRQASNSPPPPPMPYVAALPSLLTRGVPTLLLESEILGTAPIGASYVAVYTEPEGPGVLTARFGNGRAIWAIGSTPFLNHDIDKAGHLEFLLNAIGPPEEERVVLWDEYYHGYDRGLVSYLASTSLSTAFAQLALMGLVALFTFSRRRGPLRPLAVAPRASAMEFVDAVSSLYQKARASSGAVETTRAWLRRRLIAASQMPPSASDAQIASAAAARYPIDEGEVRDVLAASAVAAGQAALPADQALLLVQRMQAVASKILG